jgi:hypothetical protein
LLLPSMGRDKDVDLSIRILSSRSFSLLLHGAQDALQLTILSRGSSQYLRWPACRIRSFVVKFILASCAAQQFVMSECDVCCSELTCLTERTHSTVFSSPPTLAQDPSCIVGITRSRNPGLHCSASCASLIPSCAYDKKSKITPKRTRNVEPHLKQIRPKGTDLRFLVLYRCITPDCADAVAMSLNKVVKHVKAGTLAAVNYPYAGE